MGMGMRPKLTRTQVRAVAVVAIAILLAPVGTAAITHETAGGIAAGDATATENITLISTQGAATSQGAGVYAINTDTKEVVWSYRECPEKCFDVDPLGDDTVLFVAKTTDHKPWEIGENTTYNWKAIHINWRTGEVGIVQIS